MTITWWCELVKRSLLCDINRNIRFYSLIIHAMACFGWKIKTNNNIYQSTSNLVFSYLKQRNEIKVNNANAWKNVMYYTWGSISLNSFIGFPHKSISKSSKQMIKRIEIQVHIILLCECHLMKLCVANNSFIWIISSVWVCAR